jgi:hypothetical protein
MNTPLSPTTQLYLDLMDEARIRITGIGSVIEHRNQWAPKLLEEFVYLQLRMLCEIIAVGCLIAHGDIKDRKTLKAWSAQAIMDALDRIGADSYPRGVKISVDEKTKELTWDYHKDTQLSKKELVALWNKCGAFLHRGALSKLLANIGKQLKVELDPVLSDVEKIQNLLAQHVIFAADNHSHFLVALLTTEGGAKIWAARFVPQ